VGCVVGSGRRLNFRYSNERKWPSRLRVPDSNGSWWTPTAMSNYRYNEQGILGVSMGAIIGLGQMCVHWLSAHFPKQELSDEPNV
jgi:hypothetical protein